MLLLGLIRVLFQALTNNGAFGPAIIVFVLFFLVALVVALYRRETRVPK